MIRSPGGLLIASSVSCDRIDGKIALYLHDEHGTAFAIAVPNSLDEARGLLGDLLTLVEQSEVEAMPVAGHA